MNAPNSRYGRSQETKFELSELDGKYKVTIASNAHDFFPETYHFGEAELVIDNGKISGADVGGITYSGYLTIAPSSDAHDVEAVVIVDPRTGPSNAYVMHYDGQPKRECLGPMFCAISD